MNALDTVRESVLRINVDDMGDHLATLEAELSGGRCIELVRGAMVVAELRAKGVPAQPVSGPPAAREVPDFMGRMKAIWGDKQFPEGYMTQAIREDRDARG
jgi:hypothetical protein